MKNEIYLTKTNHGSLIASTENDKEIIKKFKKGATYKFKFSQSRNYAFLQKFFVLCKMVFDNQEVYTNFEHFRRDLTIECGFYDVQINHFTGEEVYIAKSISFGKMNSQEFDQFFKSFVSKVCTIYDFDEETFTEEVNINSNQR